MAHRHGPEPAAHQVHKTHAGGHRGGRDQFVREQVVGELADGDDGVEDGERDLGYGPLHKPRLPIAPRDGEDLRGGRAEGEAAPDAGVPDERKNYAQEEDNECSGQDLELSDP